MPFFPFSFSLADASRYIHCGLTKSERKKLDAAQEVLIEMQCLLQNCPSPQAVCTFRKLELACVQSSEANHHIKDACMFGSAVLPLLFFACASAIVQIFGQRSKDAGDCIMFQL